jgi:hypothetical protein
MNKQLEFTYHKFTMEGFMKIKIGSACKLALMLCFLNITAYARMALDKNSYSPTEVLFISEIRAAFAQDLSWERIFIVGRMASTPGLEKSRQRLLAGRQEIADILKTYYGDDTANQISLLLKQKTQSLENYADIVRSGVGDKTQVITALHDNSSNIVNLLCLQNMYLNKEELTASHIKYDDLLLAEIDLQYPDHGSAEPAACDATFSQAMAIADTISLGTMKQFPSKFW